MTVRVFEAIPDEVFEAMQEIADRYQEIADRITEIADAVADFIETITSSCAGGKDHFAEVGKMIPTRGECKKDAILSSCPRAPPAGGRRYCPKS